MGKFRFALVGPVPGGNITYWSNDGTSTVGSEPTTAVSVSVNQGQCALLLGDTSLPNMTTIPASAFQHPDVRLRVWFDNGILGSQLLPPDVRLAPNGYLPDGAVSTAALADGSVTGSKLAPATIPGDRIASSAITATHLSALLAPTPGQFLSFNGTGLTWTDPGVAAGGTFALNGTIAYYNAGNVGIGTINPLTYGHGGSARILEVHNNGTSLHSQAHLMLSSSATTFLDSAIGTVTWALPGGMAAYIGAVTRSTDPSNPAAKMLFGTRNVGDSAAQVRMVIQEDGKVGIGTPSPLGQLEVVGNDDILRLVGWQPYLTLYDSNTGYNPSRIQAAAGGFNFFTGAYLLAGNTYASMVIKGDTGNVGIGTPQPQGKLEVVAQDALRLVGYQPFLTFYDDSAGYARGRIQSVGGNITLEPESYITGPNYNHGLVITSGSGNVGIGTPNPSAKLEVAGNAYISGNASVCSVTIRGGCDLAEPFHMREGHLEKGSVVVIDEENPGQLKLSSGSYDTRVAGIVSGANGINTGIALHQEGLIEGGENVALSGRVYVRADASRCPIKPGDLLTTSDVPGRAMKVQDHARAQGAILGKAMSSLNEGQGMVLVLVTLQ